MGSFIENKRNGSTKFEQVIDTLSNNSLTFENISIKEKYFNKDIKHMEESEKNLIYFRNIIFEKYITRIIYNSKDVILTEEQNRLFDKNPYLAAEELLGNPDYWWLLLISNQKSNIDSFTKFKNIIKTPDMDDLKSLIKDELTKNENIGKVIE